MLPACRAGVYVDAHRFELEVTLDKPELQIAIAPADSGAANKQCDQLAL